MYAHEITVRILAGARGFSLIHIVKISFRTHTSLYSMCTRAPSKAAHSHREDVHLPPSRTKTTFGTRSE